MEKNTTTTISRIKSAMREQGMTQAELLKRAKTYCDGLHIHMNKSDISQFLSGKVNPGYAKVVALSRALGVNELWLLGEVDDPTPAVETKESMEMKGDPAICRSFSQNLTGFCEERGMTQKDLAQALNVSTASVNDWVHGKSVPRTPVLQKMTELFGCRLEDLLTARRGDDGMNTGARIKARRQELGLSADELASKIGKNRATVYRYENGEVENVPSKAIEALSEALKTTPVDLMGWSNEMDDRAPGDTATADTAKRGEDNTESAFRLQRYKVPDFSPKSTMIRLSPEDYHYLTVLSVATGMKKQQVLHEMVQFCKNRCVIED